MPDQNNPDLRTQRQETYRAIAALADAHVDLSVPVQVAGYRFGALYLSLEDDDREGVARWAAILGLNTPTDAPNNGFVTCQAERHGYNTSVWLGWTSVYVQAACDKQDATEAGVQ